MHVGIVLEKAWEPWCKLPDAHIATPHRSQNLVRSSLRMKVYGLRLLDLHVNKIVSRPELRHDINFDPELQFRPNIRVEKERVDRIGPEHNVKLV